MGMSAGKVSREEKIHCQKEEDSKKKKKDAARVSCCCHSVPCCRSAAGNLLLVLCFMMSRLFCIVGLRKNQMTPKMTVTTIEPFTETTINRS